MMLKKRIVFCTILSLFLITVLPLTVMGSPRGQLDRQAYNTYSQTTSEHTGETTVSDSQQPTSAATFGSGSDSGSGTTRTSNRTSRSGSYYVAPSPSAPAPAPSPTPSEPSTPPPAELPSAPAAPSWMTNAEAQAFTLLNETRIKNGVPPVQAHPGLTELARLKADDMVEYNYFAHTSPRYGSAGNMVRQAGIPYSAVGENLSKAGNVYQAHLQLEYSTKGHRQIMLNANYNNVGIGVVPLKATPGIIMVQIFIKK